MNMTNKHEPTGKTFWQKNEAFILGAGFIILMLGVWEIVPSAITLSKAM